MFPLTYLYYCRNDAYPGNNIYHVNTLVSDWNHSHLQKLSSVTYGIQYCTLVTTLTVLTDVSFNTMQRKWYFHLPNTYWIIIAFMLIISTLPLNFCANLCSVNTDVIDTLRKDRKDLPKEVAGEKHKPNERKLQYEKNVGVLCFEWKDKRDVYMKSTCTACLLVILVM